jgi:hypothetical protein
MKPAWKAFVQTSGIVSFRAVHTLDVCHIRYGSPPTSASTHVPMPCVAIAASPLLILVAGATLADQKDKSNIKNDRVASTCTQDCEAAGHAWARENRVSDPAACDSTSADFSEGCKAELEAQATSRSGGL